MTDRVLAIKRVMKSLERIVKLGGMVRKHDS